MAKADSNSHVCMIDGGKLKNMILEAAAEIESRKEEINALNVFPVPDGDTGTNMSLTLNNAAAELSKSAAPALWRVMDITSDALLRGARGNSGVITSLLFRGMAKVFRGMEEADGAALAEALAEGSATAYKAVMKPAEGTILTVSRLAGEAAGKFAKKEKNADKVLECAIVAAEIALENTIEQNPVLKKAGVVDAGGYGYVIILKAMQTALTGKPGLLQRIMDTMKPQEQFSTASADFSSFDTEEITFTYCTELLIKRTDRRRSPDKLRSYFCSIGDCVVVVDDEELIKVHVHTEAPDKVICEGLKYGSLISTKIENMREQHTKQKQDEVINKMEQRHIAEPENRFGFVSVASGEGICSLFRDLGADRMVEGGQTMNPSTEDILRAIDETPAETVFVLPNNKNIILAAMQAAPLSQKEVVVLESKTVPQGVSAMLAFNPDADTEGNSESMNEAMTRVKSGSVTYAARDSDFDGKKIKEGDYMALCEGKLVHSSCKFEDVIRRLAKTMCDKNTGFITIFCGEGSDSSLDTLLNEAFSSAAPGAELNCVQGGQPVYSYIISAE